MNQVSVGVDGLQVTHAMPSAQGELVGNGIERAIGELDIIHLFDVATNVLIAIAKGEQCNNLALQFLG